MNRKISSKVCISCLIFATLILFTGCAKREAAKVIAQADAAKQEAQAAQAPGFAPQQFNDANNLLNLANQQFEAGDYQQAIETAQKAESRFIAARDVVPVVRQRVEKQWQEIDDAITQAEENVQTARDGGVLSPETINPIAEQVNQIRTEFVDTYQREIDEEQLNNFLARVKDVLAQTESLATAHLKPQAVDAKTEVQNMIEKAQELKADIHVPDKYGQVMELWSQLETAERNGQWQAMIDLAEKIKTPLNEIIVAAQEKAAGDILADLQQQINQARSLKVDGVQAFTDAVEQAQQFMQNGQNELANQQYATAIAAADSAKAALAQGFEALGQEAQSLIGQAETNLQEAIEKEAETYAPSVVSNVRQGMSEVEQLLQNEQYAAAFSNARQTFQTSSQAILAARRGKAQSALSTVEKPFSVLHGQGGGNYVAEAYKKAASTVQDLRTKMKNGEFEAVVEGVPSAKEVVEQGIQALEKGTQVFIDKAQTALDEAQEAKAQDWVPMQYANAVNLKSAAKKELEQDRYLASIRNSEASINAAQDAEAKAYQLQTEQNLNKANELMVLAKRAEQDQLSPLAYREAVETINETSELDKNRQFENAYHRSEEALQKADRALNNLVLTAQENTESALEAQAMKYSEPEIKTALALLNDAEVAQREERFPEANEKSMESTKLAAQAEHFTWKQRSYSLIRQLEGTKEILEYHLAPQKQPALYRQVLTNIAEAKVAQIDENYDESYQYAENASEAKQEIWNNMRQDLQQQVEEMNQIAEWMGEKSLDGDGRELKMELMDTIALLKRQIQLEDWKTAYGEANEAWDVAHEASEELEKRNRVILAQQLTESLDQYKAQNALEIVPEQQQLFDETMNALKKPESEQTYADVYERYQASQDAIENLPESIVEMATQRRDEIDSILQQAQNAGAAKYFPDWFRQLSTDLQWLRNSIRGEDYKGIAQRLKKLEKEANELLLATRQANAEDEYFQTLENNLTRMNGLIQDFGTIGNMPSEIIITSRATEHKLDPITTDMYRSLQGEISVKTLRVSAEILEEQIKEMEPPETLKSLHKKAILSFTHFRKAAEGFEIYGESKTYDLAFREDALEDAYQHLYKVLDLNEELQFYAKKGRKLNTKERINWTIKKMQNEFADFYYSFKIR